MLLQGEEDEEEEDGAKEKERQENDSGTYSRELSRLPDSATCLTVSLTRRASHTY